MSVKHSLLMLLRDGPRSASQLQHAFDQATGGLWPINIGQVSQTLSRLRRDGFIESAGAAPEAEGQQPGRRATESYRLTEAGEHEAQRWWQDPVGSSASARDELMTKVLLATHDDAANLIGMLDGQRAAIIARLRELNKRARTIPQTRCAQRLAIERRIYELEAQARWLDRIEALPESE